jgi:hypothetical protein
MPIGLDDERSCCNFTELQFSRNEYRIKMRTRQLNEQCWTPVLSAQAGTPSYTPPDAFVQTLYHYWRQS